MLNRLLHSSYNLLKTKSNVSDLRRYCGTISFFHFEETASMSYAKSSSLLPGAIATLRHRGPESEGYWLSDDGETHNTNSN